MVRVHSRRHRSCELEVRRHRYQYVPDGGQHALVVSKYYRVVVLASTGCCRDGGLPRRRTEKGKGGWRARVLVCGIAANVNPRGLATFSGAGTRLQDPENANSN